MPLRVLALETYWHEDPADSRSTKAIFDLLAQNCEGIEVHHRFVSATEDLEWYFDNSWPDRPYDVLSRSPSLTELEEADNSWRDRPYDVLYIASHGVARPPGIGPPDVRVLLARDSGRGGRAGEGKAPHPQPGHPALPAAA